MWAIVTGVAFAGVCFGLPTVVVTLDDESIVRGALERFEDGVLVVRVEDGARRLDPERVREIRFVPDPVPAPVAASRPPSLGDSTEEDAALDRLETEFLRTPPARLFALTREKVRAESPDRLRRLLSRLETDRRSGERRSAGAARRELVAICLRAFLDPVDRLPGLRRQVEALATRPAFRSRFEALSRDLLKAIDDRLQSETESGANEPVKTPPSKKGDDA